MGISINKSQAIKDKLAQHIHGYLRDKKVASFEVRLPDNSVLKYGDAEPAFIIDVKNNDGLSALTRFDELLFSEAYINGNLDLHGDMWEIVNCREILKDIHPFHCLWNRIIPFLKGQLRTNEQAITDHYNYDNEFFLKIFDSTRCYSQAVFENDEESLETAQKRKLEFIIQSCQLKPGNRVLDVGGGLGHFC